MSDQNIRKQDDFDLSGIQMVGLFGFQISAVGNTRKRSYEQLQPKTPARKQIFCFHCKKSNYDL